ncbi:MAG: amino acid synthesis family protein, partial [Steroidobacteraceae bacterium]
MLPELRKVVTFDEDIYREGERAADPVLRIIGVAAVVRNPWAGRGYVEDLQPEIQRMAPVLGQMLTDRLIALAGSGDAIEAYGKAAVAGTDCEIEHASALIHTLRYGNFYREAVGAKSYLGFTNTRGPANSPIYSTANLASASICTSFNYSLYGLYRPDEGEIRLRGEP